MYNRRERGKAIQTPTHTHSHNYSVSEHRSLKTVGKRARLALQILFFCVLLARGVQVRAVTEQTCTAESHRAAEGHQWATCGTVDLIYSCNII